MIHGHTHDSSNYDYVSGVPILNANAFYKWKYGLYEIQRFKDSEIKEWKFIKKQFLDFN